MGQPFARHFLKHDVPAAPAAPSLLKLSFATIGFIAKLLADEIEEIDETQAEAIRATGASWWQLVLSEWVSAKMRHAII